MGAVYNLTNKAIPTIDQEAYSSFNCNIASGIIIENLLMLKEKDPRNPLLKPKTMFINGFTLYRNLIECLSGNTESKVNLLKSKLGEVKVIELFLEDTNYFLNGMVHLDLDEIMIYIPDYSKLAKQWPLWKSPEKLSPIKYLTYKSWQHAQIRLLTKFPGVVKRTTYLLPQKPSLYLVTHLAQDLLNYTRTRSTLLVESHTGEIKDYTKWYTKYKKFGKYEMSVFPFNELLLRYLGDNWFLGSDTPKFKKWLYGVAKQYSWNPFTTEKQVLNTIIKKDKILGNKIKKNFKKIYK